LPRHLNRQALRRKMMLVLRRKLHRNYLLRPNGVRVVGQRKPQARNRNLHQSHPNGARLAQNPFLLAKLLGANYRLNSLPRAPARSRRPLCP